MWYNEETLAVLFSSRLNCLLLAGTCVYHKLSRVEKRNCISSFHTQGEEKETGAGERNRVVTMCKLGWQMQLGKLQGADQTA